MSAHPNDYSIRELAWQVSPEFRLDIPALDLPAGRTTALLGRSASGKSTLLSLLGRVEGNYFERPENLSGRIGITFDGATFDMLAARAAAPRRSRRPA